MAKKILRETIGAYDCDDYDILRKFTCYGFASYYISETWDETDLVNKADAEIYKELITIDEKLGTTMNEQLYSCVIWSFRLDLFEV